MKFTPLIQSLAWRVREGFGPWLYVFGTMFAASLSGNAAYGWLT